MVPHQQRYMGYVSRHFLTYFIFARLCLHLTAQEVLNHPVLRMVDKVSSSRKPQIVLAGFEPGTEIYLHLYERSRIFLTLQGFWGKHDIVSHCNGIMEPVLDSDITTDTQYMYGCDVTENVSVSLFDICLTIIEMQAITTSKVSFFAQVGAFL